MGKIKTRKSLMKRLNVRQSGSITVGKAGNNHQTGKKSPAQSRRAGSKSELSHSDYKRFKEVI